MNQILSPLSTNKAKALTHNSLALYFFAHSDEGKGFCSAPASSLFSTSYTDYRLYSTFKGPQAPFGFSAKTDK